MTVKRIWHGWTEPGNADRYESLLRREVFPGIKAKKIPGFTAIELLRRDQGDEVEFVTIMTFDSLQSVIAFQGEDYARSYVPDAARKVLKRWDETAAHYEVMETRRY
jgi:antibiotic biosynthesis monooxygenase (ABM) superfamily enzyme